MEPQHNARAFVKLVSCDVRKGSASFRKGGEKIEFYTEKSGTSGAKEKALEPKRKMRAEHLGLILHSNGCARNLPNLLRNVGAQAISIHLPAALSFIRASAN